MAPPKVVKRSSAGCSTATDSDIAIQRPVAKLQNGKGMIPAPPTKTEGTLSATVPTLSVTQEPLAPHSSSSETKEITSSTEKSTQKLEPESSTSVTLPTTAAQPSSATSSLESKSGTASLANARKSSVTLTASNPLTVKDAPPNLSLGNILSGSSEKLVTNESPKPAASPQCLRPQRKIDDVTTVKRQPKTGWL